MFDLYVMTTRLEEKGWQLVAFIHCPQPEGSATAPGAIVCWRHPGRQEHNTHFYNSQDRGFHSGHYDLSRDAALLDMAERANRFVRPGTIV